MADHPSPEKKADDDKVTSNHDGNQASTKDAGQMGSQELDHLLDSALADFDKPAFVSHPVIPASDIGGQTTSLGENSSSELEPNLEWSDEFIQQATTQFEDAMKHFLSEDQSLSEEFRKMAEATGRAMASLESEPELSDSLSQTLKDLSDNAEAISNPLTDEEITQLLSTLGLSQDIGTIDGSEPDDLLHIMKNVMQNLLSKEMLYPALKEIVGEYPNWLETNRPTLSEPDYNKYKQQYELMKQACEMFETEKETDTEDVKKARFEKVLCLMHKTQECGPPPKELIGSMAAGFDDHGNPGVLGPPLPPNASESCCVM